MVQLLGGQETIPGDPSHILDISPLDVATMTQEGLGPSPAESLMLEDERRRERAIEENLARLAEMESAAAAAQESYYAEGGAGYGTYPGGPDVYYMPSDAPFGAGFIYGALDPYYGEGGILEPVTRFVSGENGKDNLLLYAALGIGALALLRR